MNTENEPSQEPLLITPEMYGHLIQKVPPVTSIVIGNDIGTLCWKTGELKFTGNADEAAKVFFDNVVAQYAQQTERLRRVEQALRGILEIGKRDTSNPKYDTYFEEAREALK